MKMVQALNLRQKNIKSSHCNSDAYILVIGDIIATNGDENADIAFKNCAAFTKSITHKWWTYWYCWKYWHYNAYAQFDWI